MQKRYLLRKVRYPPDHPTLARQELWRIWDRQNFHYRFGAYTTEKAGRDRCDKLNA